VKRVNRRVRLLPYKAGSMSARALATAAGVLRVKLNGGRFMPRANDVVVNWGNHSELRGWFSEEGINFVNHPHRVRLAVDKREAFRIFSEANVPTLEWTVDIVEAHKWFAKGDIVMQRNTATGQGGVGIVVCNPSYPFSEGGNMIGDGNGGVLWTRYFKKAREFRIHVWRNDVLDIQEKKLTKETAARVKAGDKRPTWVRSHENGWVFCRQGVTCPEAVSLAAVAAIRALGLDFGAVDIGWNEKYQKAAVFEVNTAPGLEGATVNAYANKIKELMA
jgi:hypothetical protein